VSRTWTDWDDDFFFFLSFLKFIFSFDWAHSSLNVSTDILGDKRDLMGDSTPFSPSSFFNKNDYAEVLILWYSHRRWTQGFKERRARKRNRGLKPWTQTLDPQKAANTAEKNKEFCWIIDEVCVCVCLCVVTDYDKCSGYLSQDGMKWRRNIF